MAVPKAGSIPQDDGRPSFLILPAGIRKIIHGILVERNYPLLIHNARAYHAQKPLPPQDKGADTDNVDGTLDCDCEITSESCVDPTTRDVLFSHEFKDDFAARYKEYEETLKTWEMAVQMDEHELKEFDHGIYNGLGLLQSGRQLYHESAGILYGHNRFLASRCLARHGQISIPPRL